QTSSSTVVEGVEAKPEPIPAPAAATVATRESPMVKVGSDNALSGSKQILLEKLSQLSSRMAEATETGSVVQLASAMESVAKAISAVSNLTV
ncbi:hypothetical protein BVRB_033730, partial [Beta vulgaris subsp. vulgaris]